MDKQTIGIFEKVSFPELGIKNIMAKIDTGAYSGALHCKQVKEIILDGKHVLQFVPFEQPKLVKTTDSFKKIPVTSSNGVTEQRYLVNTDITISGVTYPIRLSLSDRSSMRWPVLIGRRFLRKNNLLVDVTKSK